MTKDNSCPDLAAVPADGVEVGVGVAVGLGVGVGVFVGGSGLPVTFMSTQNALLA